MTIAPPGPQTGSPLIIDDAQLIGGDWVKAANGQTVDVLDPDAEATAIHQRSDVCAVPAAGGVAEAMVALVLAEACLEKFGGDSVAETARNPFLLDTLQYLGQFLIGATRVTRANEARRVDFAAQVADEHDRIVAAIEAGDPAGARLAAASHMDNAIRRIEQADPAFWQQEGEALARPLTGALPTLETLAPAEKPR